MISGYVAMSGDRSKTMNVYNDIYGKTMNVYNAIYDGMTMDA